MDRLKHALVELGIASLEELDEAVASSRRRSAQSASGLEGTDPEVELSGVLSPASSWLSSPSFALT